MLPRILVALGLLFAQARPQFFSLTSPDYAIESSGSPLEPDGALLTVRSITPSPAASGAATSQLPADRYRHRRITVSGELRTRATAKGASLWLRIDRGATTLMLDNGTGDAIRGDADWTARSITLPVPNEATSILFGAILQGSGSVTIRHLRMAATEPIADDAPLTPDAQQELDTAITVVKKNSLRRDQVDWTTLEPATRALAAGAVKTSDTYPAIRYLLNGLGDHHSLLRTPAQESTRQAPGGANDPVPEVRSLTGRIGYIAMPGFLSGSKDAMEGYTRDMFAGLSTAAASSSCGWILDLRNDTGGNMWPMLAGLRPFLGDGPLGTFESAEGSSSAWRAAAAVSLDVPAALRRLEGAWVAVLTGPRTVSSGEAVAISFRGRQKTRSFGQPTGGLSTSNQLYPLPDHAAIFLTTAVDADRNGHRYGGPIDPDERVGPAPSPPDADDIVAAAAKTWLTKSCRTDGTS